MKRSTVTLLLGFFVVIIAVIDNAQGIVVGVLKCTKFINNRTKEDNDVIAKCRGDLKDVPDGCHHKMKMGTCMLKVQKYLAKGIFSKAHYEAHIYAQFKDPRNAAAAKEEVTKTCAKDGQKFKSDQELNKLLLCMIKCLTKSCGGFKA